MHDSNIQYHRNIICCQSTSRAMARCMIKNPKLKVLIMNGYFDLATPFYGVEYSINHMQLPPEISKNISMKYYMTGHMMYVDEKTLPLIRKDSVDFIDEMAECMQ